MVSNKLLGAGSWIWGGGGLKSNFHVHNPSKVPYEADQWWKNIRTKVNNYLFCFYILLNVIFIVKFTVFFLMRYLQGGQCHHDHVIYTVNISYWERKKSQTV